MDPALWELLWRGSDDDEIEAVIRFVEGSAAPPRDVRVVSRFGAIATCRLKRGDIPRIRDHEAVASLKAPRLIAPETIATDVEDSVPRPDDARRPVDLAPRGRGTVIGVLDWGLDFVRQSFCRADGRTRILALWDQRDRRAWPQYNIYGYGTIHTRAVIDAALRSRGPYAALGYHPADADPYNVGAHGTVVVDLAAGNGRSGTPEGVAPEADIVFVHLASRGTGGLANLGDSIGILEGLDFIRRVAGDRPTTVSLSVGRHGGPHDGSTLVELAIAEFLLGAPGRSLAQSAGNYGLKQCHATGVLQPGGICILSLIVDASDPSENELEIWHDCDSCSVQLDSPDGTTSGWTPLGGTTDVSRGGRLIARVYHRFSDPQNGSHHVDAFIYPGAPAGEWKVLLRDERSLGAPERFHAWIERDDACLHCQSRFRPQDADASCTLGTLASSHQSLVCGAYNAHDPDRSRGAFSSAGPTRDGRAKPDLAGPGVAVLALRSQPRGVDSASEAFTRKSGTSMAAPQVAGCAALLLEVSDGRLRNEDVRELILSSVDPVQSREHSEGRLGAGYLNVARAVEAAVRVAGARRGFIEVAADVPAVDPGTDASADSRYRHDEGIGTMNSDWPREAIVNEVDATLSSGNGQRSDGVMRAFLRLASPYSEPVAAYTPDLLYRSLVYGSPEPPATVRALAVPGSRLEVPLGAGDAILRVALGEPGFGHLAVLVDGRLMTRDEVAARGATPEAETPGHYAMVVEAGARPHRRTDEFARLITDLRGFVPLGQMIIRVGPSTDVLEETPVEASPDGASLGDLEDASFPFLEEFEAGTSVLVASALGEMLEEAVATTFSVGNLVPTRTFVEMPLTYEDFITNATGTGIVLQRTRCETLAHVASEGRAMPLADDGTFEYAISHADLITAMSGVPMLWNTTSAGRLQAALDLVIFHPADPGDLTRLPPGSTRFPLVIIVMGNHSVCSTSMSGAADPPTGAIGPSGLPLRVVHSATFGTEIVSHHGYSAVSRGRPPGVVTGPATVPYLQEELATYGIISVSVSTNAANYFDLLLETRADLILKAVAQMRRLNNDRTSRFFHRIDFDKVAFVGHSRGGDAVIRAALKHRSLNVRALVQLAPTDITGLVKGAAPIGVPGGRVDAVTTPMRVTSALEAFHLIAYGSRDGDVSGLQDVRVSEFGDPFRHYDRSSAHRSYMFWHGATHNRFNRFWEDADEEPLMDLAAGGLLDRADQEKRTSEIVGACLRFVLNRDVGEADRLNGRKVTTIATARPVAAMWKFGRNLKTIDRFDDARGDRNTLGGRNVPPASGLVDEVLLANENPAGAGISAFQFMHIDRVLRASLPSSPLPGTGGLPGAVSSGRWRAQIPTGDQNFSAFTLLTLRVTKKYDPAAILGGGASVLKPRLTVRLVDNSGTTHDEPASGRLSALPSVRKVTLGTPPATTTLDLTKFHFETWEVELSSFVGVDLHHVVAVEIEMTGFGGQPIYVDTISLVRL